MGERLAFDAERHAIPVVRSLRTSRMWFINGIGCFDRGEESVIGARLERGRSTAWRHVAVSNAGVASTGKYWCEREHDAATLRQSKIVL